MAENPANPLARGRTATRHKYVAPPGFEANEPRPGQKTIGRYEIVKVLGKGAMGVVYQARDPMLDRIVAVKTIVSPKGQGNRVRKAYLERFEREAKAAAKMQHPAIVTIFDVGADDGLPFMVLEFLPGESLADRLDRVRIPLGRAVQIGLDLASALGFAHKHRIVHRDVKPANVLHAGESRWKLADFGIARLPDSDLTQVGIFMGTPGYAPPEAISEGAYTSQADVFAWGAVLYELLSGRIPYEGPDTRTTNSYVLQKQAKPPTQFDPSIPDPLSEVTMRAIHPSTEVRYRDGEEAEAALRKAWELCLQSGLISPMVLTAQETPHEKAPKHFHAAPRHDSDHAHDTDTRDAPLVIESRREASEEDDPTHIYQGREDSSGERRRTTGRRERSPSGAQKLGVGSTQVENIEQRAKKAAARSNRSTPQFERLGPTTKESSSRTFVWMALLLVVVCAGMVSAYIFLK